MTKKFDLEWKMKNIFWNWLKPYLITEKLQI